MKLDENKLNGNKMNVESQKGVDEACDGDSIFMIVWFKRKFEGVMVNPRMSQDDMKYLIDLSMIFSKLNLPYNHVPLIHSETKSLGFEMILKKSYIDVIKVNGEIFEFEFKEVLDFNIQ